MVDGHVVPAKQRPTLRAASFHPLLKGRLRPSHAQRTARQMVAVLSKIDVIETLSFFK